jgi:hypothetical protein
MARIPLPPQVPDTDVATYGQDSIVVTSRPSHCAARSISGSWDHEHLSVALFLWFSAVVLIASEI